MYLLDGAKPCQTAQVRGAKRTYSPGIMVECGTGCVPHRSKVAERGVSNVKVWYVFMIYRYRLNRYKGGAEESEGSL